MSTAWLFVDLNSYFASVEQELNPNLRGKPVAVLPVLADTTCCIAASYEAKAYGVKTGTRVFEAKKMCPGIQFVEARHRVYVDYHHRIVEAVESCLPVNAVLSIDEMACKLRGSDQKIPTALALAKDIKQRILRVGSQLRCSVGLAPNRFLAKVASDMQKPDGLTLIRNEDLPHILYKLKPRDFPGIGAQMEIRLQRENIYTVEELFTADEKKMRKIWGGIGGERFYQWLRGKDIDVEYQQHKSIGHSHILPPQLRNPNSARAVAQKLLHKAAARLRKIDYWCAGMALSIRYDEGSRWSMDCKMLECQDTITLNEILLELWALRSPGNPIKVSITLFDLIPSANRTFSFFDNKRRESLSKAMDSVNAKYGHTIVYLGGTHLVRQSAPTRIAFSSMPEFEFD